MTRTGRPRRSAGRGCCAAASARFNRGFEWLSRRLRRADRGGWCAGSAVVVVIYVALIGAAGFEFCAHADRLHPRAGPGLSDHRPAACRPAPAWRGPKQVVKQAIDIILTTPGIEHVAPFAGPGRDDVHRRVQLGDDLLRPAVALQPRAAGRHGELGAGRSAQAAVGDPGRLRADHPAAAGAGHRQFRRLQDDAGGPRRARHRRRWWTRRKRWSPRPTRIPSFAGVFTLLNTGSPSVYADIDRLKAEKVGLTPTDVFNTLQVYLGSQYVNDFNLLGRTYQVIAQADGRFRRDRQDLIGLKARNAARRDGADRHRRAICRTRRSRIACRATICIPAAEVQGVAAPGVATGTALQRMEELAAAGAAARHRLRMDRDRLSSRSRRARRRCWCSAPRRCSSSWCWPRTTRAGSCRSSVVLIVPMCLLASVTRAAVPRHADRHPGADRLRGAGRAGGEERDPDRRVRAPGAGRRQRARRRRRSVPRGRGCGRS